MKITLTVKTEIFGGNDINGRGIYHQLEAVVEGKTDEFANTPLCVGDGVSHHAQDVLFHTIHKLLHGQDDKVIDSALKSIGFSDDEDGEHFYEAGMENEDEDDENKDQLP